MEEGQISRDTCSIGNHLLEESKNSHKAVSASGISCWIQREGRRGWRTVAIFFFFGCSISLSYRDQVQYTSSAHA